MKIGFDDALILVTAAITLTLNQIIKRGLTCMVHVLFIRDFRTVPHEAQFDQLSSRENGKSHGYNQLASAWIDGPYIK